MLFATSRTRRDLQSLDWSPDGSQLAIDGFDNQELEHNIYTLDFASGDFELVIRDVGGSLEWSPDGRTILAFREVDYSYAVTLVAADGNGRVDLTDGSFRALYPGWSANGKQVVFETPHPFPPSAGVYNIWIMDVDGSDMFRYTYFDEDKARFPRWAP
jgi:Tol biopolymer transport system component